MVTSSVSRSPGWTTRLKRHSSMAAKRPMRSPKPSCARRRPPSSGPAPRPGARRASPAAPGSGPGSTTRSRSPPSRRGCSRAPRSSSTMRSTSRNGQRCGMRLLDLRGASAGRLGGASGFASAWLGSSVCRSARRPAASRNAALPTRSSRLVVNSPSRNVSSPSSARWNGTLVTSPSTTSSSSATRDRAMAVSRSGPQTMSLPSSES